MNPFFTTGFAVGIILLQLQATLPSYSFSPLLVSTGIGCYPLRIFNWPKRTPSPHPAQLNLILITTGLIIGFSYSGWRAEQRLSEQLPSTWENQDIVVEGYVSELPQFMYDSPRPGWRLRFTVEQATSPGQPLAKPSTDRFSANFPQNLRLSWYGDVPANLQDEENDEPAELSPNIPDPGLLKPGQRWRLTVRLKQPHGPANPGSMDFEGWLFAHNLRATGYVRKMSPPQYLGQQPWSLHLWVEQQRARLRQAIQRALPVETYPASGIVIGLAIGDQGSIPGKQWELFNQTGLTHLMVVSGSHITLLAALLAWITLKAWGRFSPRLPLLLPAPKAAALVGLCTAAFYTALSGLGIPALRTLSMLTVVTLGLFNRRFHRTDQILQASLLVVLLIDPWAVLAPGFWLSFATVGALLLTRNLSTYSVHAGFWGHLTHHLKQFTFAQWAATLATLPLLSQFFHGFPLVAPFANLLAIPLISLIVTPLILLGVVLIGITAPFSGGVANIGQELASHLWHFCHLFLVFLLETLPWFAQIPLWSVTEAPAWASGLAIVGIVLLLLPRIIPAQWFLGTISLLPGLYWPVAKPDATEWWADVLDVGQGQAVLIRTQSHSLLYDSGPGPGIRFPDRPDAAQRVVLPFMRTQGINHLDTLILSHRDLDHAGSAHRLKSTIPIEQTRSPGVFPEDKPCLAGQTWEWSGVRFEILHPQAAMLESPPRNTNAVSCVLRISSPQGSFLLTGDLPEKEEQALLETYPALRTDILLAPHHGSKTSSSEAFLGALNAHTVIISAGYLNRFGHPHPEVLHRYTEAGLKIWRTDQGGAIQIRPDGISAWRTTKPRYWQPKS